MDASTAHFYSTNAAECAACYEGANVPSLHEVLRSLATAAPSVLEIGGGSGRDAAFLVRLGCDTTYTDGCEAMLAQALELHPELAGRARCAAFPLPEDVDLLCERYDMVLCAAVIMHLDDASLEGLAVQLSQMVADTGWLVLSHSRGHRCPSPDRDSCGRLFIERTPASVNSVLRNVGFRPVQLIENPDGLGRDGITWATHVLQKTS